MVFDFQMDTRFRTVINDILSTQLLREILQEIAKYDTWKSNLLRGHLKSKQPNPMSRDQLERFAKAEKQRLDSACVHLQYVMLPLLQHPEKELVETPYASKNSSDLHTTELHKLSEWVLKRDELKDNFHAFLQKSKSKVPVHKQDHDPVRHCPNPKCNNIALFKHTPDSLVCVSCGMKQTVLDNNIAYGEEQVWRDVKTRKAAKETKEKNGDVLTVRELLDTPHRLKQVPKKFDLTQMFHYNVEAPPSLADAQSIMTQDMMRFMQSNEQCHSLQQRWQTKRSSAVILDATYVWKQHLKQCQLTHTPAFVITCVFVLLQWSPPPISAQLHTELSQTLFLFDTALLEYQQQHPDDSKQIHKIRSANFRKYVLLQLIHTKPQIEHLQYFITLSKHDKLNRLYELAFQLICHYIDAHNAKK